MAVVPIITVVALEHQTKVMQEELEHHLEILITVVLSLIHI